MSTSSIAKPLQSIEHTIQTSKTSLGFWLYLMTDLMLFGSLFATYIVLKPGTAGGPGPQELFDLPYVFIETLLLLLSSFACGLALLYAYAKNKTATIVWLSITGALGLAFLAMEIHEFSALIHEGHSWTQSGFLSGYFGLVGTHGLHITIGLLWLVSTIAYLLYKPMNMRFLQRLTLFSMFWHFLDIVWICIFTIVYLMGVIG